VARIVVLLHHHHKTKHQPRWIALDMVDAWRAMGHEVTIQRGLRSGLRNRLRSGIKAELLVPCVDLSVMPDPYVEYFKGFENVVNRRVVDISKRSFSRLGIVEGDGYEGAVIVKTNLNFGGLPERALARRGWRNKRIFRPFFGAQAPEPVHPDLSVDPRNYSIFDSVRDLPDGTLTDPRFHVERFLPEMEGANYCARTYAFGGTSNFTTRTVATQPIVKATGVIERKVVDGCDEIRAVREELGFDFGKFDYTIVDGVPRLFDVNRTPTFGDNPDSAERHSKIAADFAMGILEQFDLT